MKNNDGNSVQIAHKAALAKPTELTQKQENFALHYVTHGNAIDAYRAAYNVQPSTNRNSLRVSAYARLNHPKIRARISALQAAASAGAVASTAELVEALEEVVEADVAEVMALTVGACRHCYGLGGAYHWRSPDEHAMAAARALDSGERPPGAEGGYGYRNDVQPNPDCSACEGMGVQRLHMTPTAELSRGARRLIKGFEMFPDGRVKRLHVHDQAQLRIELMKVRGMYVDRSVSLNLNAKVPDLKDMSRDDMLDMLEQLKPTKPEPAVIDVTPEPAESTE